MPTDDRAFQDMRSDAKLLSSERPPKRVKYTKKNPIPPKLRALQAKISGAAKGAVAAVNSATNAAGTAIGGAIGGAAGATIGKQALRGATKVAAAAAAGKVVDAIQGRISKPLASLQKVSSMFAMGANIIEELDPKKLKRPLIEGPSVDKLTYAADLAETTAAGVMGSLIAGVPLASGLPAEIKSFRTLLDLKNSPRFFNSSGSSATSVVNTATTVVTTTNIYKQRGLLEDEIMYRLVLIAENVYQPLADYAASHGYPGLRILEGYRSENSGVSPHERGEAIDIGLAGGTVHQLRELAVWARDNIAYDQLILCHSGIAGGQHWLHITYTPDSRRRQVFTKTYNDTFEPGLHVYMQYTDSAVKAADVAAAKSRDKITSDVMQRLSARDARLNPVGVNTLEQSSVPQTTTVTVAGSAGGGGSVGGVPPTGAPKAVYVGHPGGTCSLFAMPSHSNWAEETGSFDDQVQEAQAEVLLNNPTMFNTDGSVIDPNAYVDAVAAVLRSYGFCATRGGSGPDDEVAIKINNEWNDQYDIVIGGTNMPWCAYMATLRPAGF